MNATARRPVLILRPEPGNAASVAAGRIFGLDMHGFPLFTIEPVAWELPADTSFDALLAGSANVFRHGGEKLMQLKHLPVYAVGETTAELARETGFTVEHVGHGGLQTVLDAEEKVPRRYLRLGGEERVTLTIPSLQTLHEITVYRAKPAMLDETARDLLTAKSIAALHSAAAAQRFASECRRMDVNVADVTLAALGPRIAQAAGPGWAHVAVAREPTDAALLEMIVIMCK